MFLIELVIVLNTAAYDLIERAGSRWLVLTAELRALAAESELARLRPHRPQGDPPLQDQWSTWSAAADGLATDVLAAARARRRLERRYLAGRRALFPDLFDDSRRLRRSATRLLRHAEARRQILGLELDPDGDRSWRERLADRLRGLRLAARDQMGATVAPILEESRALTYWEVGYFANFNAILDAQ